MATFRSLAEAMADAREAERAERLADHKRRQREADPDDDEHSDEPDHVADPGRR